MLKNILKDFFLTNLQKEIKKSNSQIIILNDWIGLKILIDKYYEKDEIEVLKKHFNDNIKNNTFVDVGANIGNHSLYFQKYFRRIIAFEPQKKIFKILKLDTEDFKNIKVFNYGLDSKSYFTEFSIPYSNSGMASELKKDLDSYTEKVEFKVFDNSHKDVVSYIKIDVEGNEEKVIMSMRKVIIKNLPVISFELNLDQDLRKKIIENFNSMGYNKFFVSEKYFFPRNIRFIKRFFGKPKKLKPISVSEMLSSNKNYSLVHTYSEKSNFKLNV